MELLEYKTPPSPNRSVRPNNALGAAHAAFLVDDIHAEKRELETKGVTFYSDVNVVDDGPLAAGGGAISLTRTASHSSCWRLPTAKMRSGRPRSRNTWRVEATAANDVRPRARPGA